MSRRPLQILLSVIGAVATGAGGRGVVRGSAEVLGGGAGSPSVDSEYRFYAAWYAVFGVLLLGAARRPEESASVVRACGAGFFLAACGRLLSMRALGPPHRSQKVLTAIELVIPAVVVPWQRRLARRRC